MEPPQSGCLSWTRWPSYTCTLLAPAVRRWIRLSSASQLRTHYWNKHSYATSAAGPSSSRCSRVEATAQLRRVRGRVEDTYRYKIRTCRCRLGLTRLLSAWFSLGVRSQTDQGKTNDGDATSVHPCSMYGEPSNPRRPSYESSSSCRASSVC